MSRLVRQIHVPLADDWTRVTADATNSLGDADAKQTNPYF